MQEITFIVEEAAEGGYIAHATEASIYTQADTQESLHAHIRDAIRCHFEENQLPKRIRLHYVRDEVIAA